MNEVNEVKGVPRRQRPILDKCPHCGSWQFIQPEETGCAAGYVVCHRCGKEFEMAWHYWFRLNVEAGHTLGYDTESREYREATTNVNVSTRT